MPTKVMVLRFLSPYHVGWRTPSPLIDHTTVLRALASLSYSLGIPGLAKAISNGEVRASSILPAGRQGGVVRLLVPFPFIPVLTKKIGVGHTYMPLEEIPALLSAINNCFGSGRVPYIRSQGDDVWLFCDGQKVAAIHRPGLKDKKGASVVSLSDKMPVFDEVTKIVAVRHYRNRIDRVTGSADVYQLRGYFMKGAAWIAVQGEKSELAAIAELLKILGELGIGAYRSRGWGRFELVEDATIHQEDLNALENRCSSCGVLAYLLGSYPIDRASNTVELSLCRLAFFEGKAGPTYAEYDLPVMRVARTGCIVKMRRKPCARTIKIPLPRTPGVKLDEPFIVFNPITITQKCT